MVNTLKFSPLEVKGIRGIVYGDSGVGKTSFILSAYQHPDLAKVAVFDVDKGLNTVVGVDPANIHSTPIENSHELLNATKQLVSRRSEFDEYNSLVVDSVSRLLDLDMRFIAKEAYNADPDKRYSPLLSQLQDYNLEVRLFSNALDSLLSSGKNIFYTAGVGLYDPTPQKPTRKSQRRALMNDAAWNALVYRMDFVWFMYTMPSGDIRLQTQSNTAGDGRETYCKTRNEQFNHKLLDISLKQKDGSPTGVINIGHRTDPNVTRISFADIYALYIEATKGE